MKMEILTLGINVDTSTLIEVYDTTEPFNDRKVPVTMIDLYHEGLFMGALVKYDETEAEGTVIWIDKVLLLPDEFITFTTGFLLYLSKLAECTKDIPRGELRDKLPSIIEQLKPNITK